jgi:hypothetical protein
MGQYELELLEKLVAKHFSKFCIAAILALTLYAALTAADSKYADMARDNQESAWVKQGFQNPLGSPSK